MNGWLAGSAISTFPVAPGTALGGYADRTEGATDTHDALEIGALALRLGDEELIIVSADIVAVDHLLVDEVAIAAGVAPDRLLICASHTHSGPLGVAHRLHPAGTDPADPAMRSRFVTSLARTIRESRAQIEPVTLVHSEAIVAGAWGNRNEPDAPADDRIRSLQVRANDGSLRCLLLLVPCHPTVLGASNRRVSADLHGGVRRATRSALPLIDTGAHVMTISSAAGDISTRFTREEATFAEVDRVGKLVANRTIPSLAHSISIGTGLRTTARSVTLPMRPIDASVAAHELEHAERALRRAELAAEVTEPERRRLYTRVQGARMLQALGELAPIAVMIRGWRLGRNFALVSFPGELFSSLGLELERRSPIATTWVAGYANGSIGYLPDANAYERSTYEALASPFDPSAGRAVLGLAGMVLQALDA